LLANESANKDSSTSSTFPKQCASKSTVEQSKAPGPSKINLLLKAEVNKKSQSNLPKLPSLKQSKPRKKSKQFSTFPISHFFASSSHRPPPQNPKELSPATSLSSSMASTLSLRPHSQSCRPGSTSPIQGDLGSYPRALTLRYQTIPCGVSSYWRPKELEYRRTDHPLDKSCSQADLSFIRKICNLPPQSIVVSLTGKDQENALVRDFHSLLGPDSPINQQIIHLFLHQLSKQFQTAFLESGFFSLLRDNGWNRVHNWVFPRLRSHLNNLPNNVSSMIELPVISIPCHVNGCHWVAITRRIISGQVYFFYMQMT
jgi:hypothetical protein